MTALEVKKKTPLIKYYYFQGTDVSRNGDKKTRQVNRVYFKEVQEKQTYHC